MFMSWLRRNRGLLLRWSAFALLLGGVAWALDAWLPPEPRWSARGAFPQLSLLPDGSAVVHIGVAGVTVRDLRTGKPITFLRDTERIEIYLCSLDSRHIAAATGDELWVAEPASGHQRRLVDLRQIQFADSRAFPNPLIFLPDGKHLLMRDAAGNTHRVSLRDGKLDRPWPKSWSFDAAGADGRFLFFHTPDDTRTVHIWDLHKQAPAGAIAHAEYLAASADGTMLFARQHETSGSPFDRVLVWDLPGARRMGEIRLPPGEDVRLALAPDVRTAAVWSGPHPGAGNIRLEFWELNPLRQFASAQLAEDHVWQALYSPDGTCFIFQCAHVLMAFDAATGAELWRESLEAGPVPLAFLFTSDSHSLIVQTSENLQWRDARTGTLQAKRFANGEVAVPETRAWQRDRLAVYEVPGWGRARPASWLEQQMRRWLPATWLPAEEDRFAAYVLDARNRRVLFELSEPALRMAMLSDDGQTLLTTHGNDGSDLLLRAWDVPAHKPLHWVLGVPLTLAAMLLTVRAGWRRWRRRPRAASHGAKCTPHAPREENPSRGA